MNKITRLILVAFCCFSAFSACSKSEIDRLIPSSATNGALDNITFLDITEDVKSINGGTLVSGWVVVPYDIKREQVKPTLLAATKRLKEKYRRCEWIVVYAIPSPELKRLCMYAGEAEYTAGKIHIKYGIPSTTQIAEGNKILGPDYEPIRLLDKKEFDLAVAVVTTWQGYKERLIDAASDTRLLKLTSQKLNLPAAKVKMLRHQLSYYNVLCWGEETVS